MLTAAGVGTEAATGLGAPEELDDPVVAALLLIVEVEAVPGWAEATAIAPPPIAAVPMVAATASLVLRRCMRSPSGGVGARKSMDRRVYEAEVLTGLGAGTELAGVVLPEVVLLDVVPDVAVPPEAIVVPLPVVVPLEVEPLPAELPDEVPVLLLELLVPEPPLVADVLLADGVALVRDVEALAVVAVVSVAVAVVPVSAPVLEVVLLVAARRAAAALACLMAAARRVLAAVRWAARRSVRAVSAVRRRAEVVGRAVEFVTCAVVAALAAVAVPLPIAGSWPVTSW